MKSSATIRLVFCGKKHPVCEDGLKSPLYPPACRSLFFKWGVDYPTDCAVMAMAGKNKCVGVFRYNVDRRTIYPQGTWVHPEYQNKGIANRMWRYVLLRKMSVRAVDVTVATKSGKRLITSLMRQIRGLTWFVYDNS